MVQRRLGGREAAHRALDSQPAETPFHGFPSNGVLVEVDAVDRVEIVKGAGQFVAGGKYQRIGHGLTQEFFEVLDTGCWIEPEFMVNDQIVAHPVSPDRLIRDAQGAFEPMQPSKKRQAQIAPARASYLLVQVALFPPKSGQPGIEARPRLAAASERPSLAFRFQTVPRKHWRR